MITGVHLLLSYKCSFECDHCFLFCSPRAEGTFTLEQIEKVIGESVRIGTVKQVFFEGGEPFLFYPLMVEGIRMVRNSGLEAGIVTNSYWATTEKDAELWLRPLAELGIANLSLSDDAFHYGDEKENPASHALAAAKKLGIPVSVISIEKPRIEEVTASNQARGEPIIGGNTMFRGRAVEKLTEGLPTRPWKEFTECPYEDLKNPARIHLDPYGNVHLCQGLCMGNMWQTPLSELIKTYDYSSHPVCRPLVTGGPALLASEHGVGPDERFIDACHLCYSLRLRLLDTFPDYLAPRQVYGL
ncbi:MAG TPA: radical SAM protein [Dehalococcoidia bacterium]|nr:radical SAM protein [Dehalococcoidia bacterium]